MTKLYNYNIYNFFIDYLIYIYSNKWYKNKLLIFSEIKYISISIKYIKYKLFYIFLINRYEIKLIGNSVSI